MDYKISEVVAHTGVPKSTVLYYIKEGLLPEAKKLKSNVHRYSNEHIELIRYIKYMQQELGISIEQLRHILQNPNQSFSSSSSMLAPLMQTLMDIGESDEHLTKEAFIATYTLDKALLEHLLEDTILMPVNDNDFTQKELSIYRLVESFLDVGVEYEILRAYAYHAAKLAELDEMLQQTLCARRNSDNFSTLWKIMFETLFNAKPYLFNRYTYQALLKTLKEEVKTV